MRYINHDQWIVFVRLMCLLFFKRVAVDELFLLYKFFTAKCSKLFRAEG